MPHTISAQLEAHLNQEVTTLARLMKVTRRDGAQLFFTDAVEPIEYETNEYRSDLSFTSSAIFASSVMTNAQSVSVVATMDDTGFREGDLRRRLYDGAEVNIYICNYADISMGAILKFAGVMGEIKLTDKGRVMFEVVTVGRSIAGNLAYEKYSATCRASLGDTRCGVDIDALKVAITVSAASGQVIAAAALTQADNHWQNGFIKWITGNNAGSTQPIVASNLASNSVTISGSLLQAAEAGDTAEVFPGCDKTVATCRDRFNNILRMRAEPYVPSKAITNIEDHGIYQHGLIVEGGPL